MWKPGVCDSPGEVRAPARWVVPGFLEEEASALEQERGGTAGWGRMQGECSERGNCMAKVLTTYFWKTEGGGWGWGWEEGER